MDQYKPGDQCPKSGIYDVVHDGVHQDKHQVTMVKGRNVSPMQALRPSSTIYIGAGGASRAKSRALQKLASSDS